jgi:hypothetical protein
MRERRSLLKCCLKISRLPDSYELTTDNIVEVWLTHGLTTTLGGARFRVLRLGGIPSGFGWLNSGGSQIQHAQAKREFSRSSRDPSQLRLKAKGYDAF